MAKATAAEQKGRKVISTYLTADYRDLFNDMLDDLGVNRYDYLKALVLQDMVRREAIDPKEVRRGDRHLLEI